jgi:hypothetical protein
MIGGFRAETNRESITYNIPSPPVPDNQNVDRDGGDKNHQPGGSHIRAWDIYASVIRVRDPRDDVIQRQLVRQPILDIEKPDLEVTAERSEPRSLNRAMPKLTGTSTR